MALKSGSTIGPFEITGSLGEGGMGQVYRARDTRLQRDVAIKVLPDAFAADTDRLARFKREAQTLAALSHPNIAAIYGFEESGDTRALVMELVAGSDLSAVIARGPMALEDALPIARQIIDALEAAHEKGVIHRDLKPGNIKVAPDGSVRVLDFGLAKLVDASDGTESGSAASAAATVTSPAMTQLGLVLGTAAYMSPEQAKGRVVDRRADIWAFGAVLFEMLSGKRPFPGDDISDVLATVLKSEPDWKGLPASTPSSIQRLLRRCLEKDPRKRLGAISDARFDLDDATAPGAAVEAKPAAARRSKLSYLLPALTGGLIAAGVALALWPRVSQSSALSRTSMVAPPGTELYPDSVVVTISPDGRYVAFVTGSPIDRQHTQLWVRAIDSLTAVPLEGTQGAALPFWKPDSSRIGFFAGTKLKSVAIGGGRVDVVTDAPFGRGGTWNEQDVIVFSGDASGTLSRVSADGGDSKRITEIDEQRKQVSHRFPVFLPDGDHFLFAALPGHDGKFNIFAGSLSSPGVTLIGEMGSTPVYAEPGWLLYGRRGVLVAQPFDAKTLKTTGDARPLGDEPTTIVDASVSYTAGPTTSVSRTGTLGYFSAPSSGVRLTWLDAAGRAMSVMPLQPGPYTDIALSPDGGQAVLVRSISPTESSLGILDVVRGASTPLSSGGGRNETPVWSPDGRRVLFASDRSGAQDLYVKTVADAAPEQPFYQSSVLFKTPSDWSRDGKSIAFNQLDPGSAYNVYTMPATAGTPTLASRGPGREVFGHFSPDLKWLAYLAEFGEAGFQLCVQAHPVPGRTVQLSTDGAGPFWWTTDSRQIIYVSTNLKELWRIDLQLNGTELGGVGQPVKLGTLPAGTINLDAMPDRKKFLALVPDRVGVGSITVVQNWAAGLGK